MSENPQKPKIPPRHPLTDEHRLTLERLLAATEETDAYLSACEACHLDVAKLRRDNAEQREIAASILREFFGRTV